MKSKLSIGLQEEPFSTGSFFFWHWDVSNLQPNNVGNNVGYNLPNEN